MKKDQTESEDSFIESEIYPIIKFKIGGSNPSFFLLFNKYLKNGKKTS